MLSYIVSIYTLIYVLFSFLIYYPIAFVIWVVTVLFDKNLRLLHKFTTFWGISFIAINPFIRVVVEGREKINKNETYVLISNHQSLLDIVVLFKLHTHFKWVAKKELFKVPFVGWTMRLNRYIGVDRANKLSHAKMFKECDDNLSIGNSIMIFPEGTRSADAEIQFFKEGAFKMALASKKPVVPIVLDGTAAAIPKKGLFFRKMASIHIKVLEPVQYSAMENSTAKQLAANFQEIISTELRRLREEKL